MNGWTRPVALLRPKTARARAGFPSSGAASRRNRCPAVILWAVKFSDGSRNCSDGRGKWAPNSAIAPRSPRSDPGGLCCWLGAAVWSRTGRATIRRLSGRLKRKKSLRMSKTGARDPGARCPPARDRLAQLSPAAASLLASARGMLRAGNTERAPESGATGPADIPGCRPGVLPAGRDLSDAQ